MVSLRCEGLCHVIAGDLLAERCPDFRPQERLRLAFSVVCQAPPVSCKVKSHREAQRLADILVVKTLHIVLHLNFNAHVR